MSTCELSKNENLQPLMSSSSPDDLALVDAARDFGIKFVERNSYNELIIENEHHQRS